MGLSGRKVKQRIPKDPRNLSWATDAGRFGSNYLSKFGWDTSKGLGAEGEGRTSHIKVTHKLDMLGIGADHQRDPNGLAWKQNKDFEILLKRLNADAENQALDITLEDGSRQTAEAESNNVDSEETTGMEHKKKRRKKDKDAQGCSPQEPMHETRALEVEQMLTQVVSPEIKKKVARAPRHRSHRAKAIAARNMSSKSEAHISEILGIALTPSSSGLNSETETVDRGGKLTTFSDDLQIDKIKTSTKSVADYFKEKLDSQALKRSSCSIPLVVDTAGEYIYDAPRTGLGASRIGFSSQSESAVEGIQRMGFSSFSSLMSSSIVTATSPFSTTLHASLAPSIGSPSPRVDNAPIANKNLETDMGSSKNKAKEKKKKRKRGTEASEETGEVKDDGLYVNESPTENQLESKVRDKSSIVAFPDTQDQDMGESANEQPAKKQRRAKKLGENDTKQGAKALCDSITSEDISSKKTKGKHKRKSRSAEEV